MNNHYNKKLVSYAHELRRESVSKAEKFIWKSLLARGQMGVKFKRQRPIDKFIVDFFAQEIGLIIEIDGNSHDHNPAYDEHREARLKSLGFHIIRFKEGTVLNQLDHVHYSIAHAIHCLK